MLLKQNTTSALLGLQADDVKEEKARSKRKRQRWRLRFQAEVGDDAPKDENEQVSPSNFCIHIIDQPAVAPSAGPSSKKSPSEAKESKEAKEPRSNSFASEIACRIANFFVSREFLAMLPQGSLDRRSVAVVGKDGTVSGLAMAMIGARVIFFGDNRNVSGVRANVNSYFKETPDYTGRKSPHVMVAVGPAGRANAIGVDELSEALGIPPPLDLILLTDGPGILGLDEKIFDVPEADEDKPMVLTTQSMFTLKQTPIQEKKAGQGKSTICLAQNRPKKIFHRTKTEEIKEKTAEQELAEKQEALKQHNKDKAMQRIFLLLKLLEPTVPENAHTRILFARSPLDSVETPSLEMASFELPCGHNAHWSVQVLHNLLPVVELLAIERVERLCSKEGFLLRKKIQEELDTLAEIRSLAGVSQPSSMQSSMQDLHAPLWHSPSPNPRPLAGVLGTLRIPSRPQTSDATNMSSLGLSDRIFVSSRPQTSDRQNRPMSTQQRREALQASLMQNNAELKDQQIDLVRETDHWRVEKRSVLHAIEQQDEMIKSLRSDMAGPLEPSLGCPCMPPSLALRQGKVVSADARRSSSIGQPEGVRTSPRRPIGGDVRQGQRQIEARRTRITKPRFGKSLARQDFLQLCKLT